MSNIFFFDDSPIKFETISSENMKDIRFPSEKNLSEHTKRRLNRSLYRKDTSAVMLEGDSVMAVLLSSDGVWNGLKALFINAFLVSDALLSPRRANLKDILTDFVVAFSKKAFSLDFDTILLEVESSNKEIISLFKVLPILHSRNLTNFSVDKELLLKNTSETYEKTLSDSFNIKEEDIASLPKYRSFMDSRPGWLTRENNISEKNGDILVAVKTEFDRDAAIAVFNPKTGVVSRLATMPLSRKRGFASSLLCFCAKKTKTNDISVVDINEKNEEAGQFLKNLGFKEELVKSEYTFSLKN